MKRIFLIVMAVVALLIISGEYAAEAKDNIELRLRLCEGMTYTKIETTEVITDQEILGENVHTSITTRYEYTNEVLNVDLFGAADVLITYKSIYYKQDGPNGIEEYDSENPNDEIPDSAQGYAAVIGGKFTVRYSPQGEILAIEGIEALIDQIVARYGIEDEEVAEYFRESIKAVCNAETIKEAMSLPTGIYPKEAVQVGSGWKESKQIDTGFPIKIESEWHLGKISDGNAYISVQTKVSPNQQAEPLVIESIKISYEIYGTMTGDMEVSESTGLVNQADQRLELSGDVKLDGIPGVEETVTSHIVVKGRTHSEIIDLALPAVR